jgi:hypothetical protein
VISKIVFSDQTKEGKSGKPETTVPLPESVMPYTSMSKEHPPI